MFVDGSDDKTELTYDCSNVDLSYTIHIVAIDKTGKRSDVKDVFIEIKDDTPPVLDVKPSPQDVFLEDNGSMTIVPDDFVVSVSDNCSGVANIALSFVIGNNDVTSISYTCADAGQTKTVTIAATDQKGKRTQKSVTINIKDNIKPTFDIISPLNPLLLDAAGNLTVLPASLVMNQSDNCTPPASIVFMFVDNGTDKASLSFTCANKGDNEVSIVAIDLAGNRSDIKTFTIVVQDNTPPTFDAAQGVQAVYLDNDGNKTIAAKDYVSNTLDNCTAVSDLVFMFADGTPTATLSYNCTNLGQTITLPIIAIDQEGNRSAPKNITVNILDNISPVFNVAPDEQEIELDNAGSVTILPESFISNPSDNCTAPDDIVFKFVDGAEITSLTYSCSDKGSKILTIVAYDLSNNRSLTKTVTINIKDNFPPAITCPTVTYPNVEGYFPTNSSNQCTYTGSFAAPVATDNCPGNLTKTYIITNSGIPVPGGSGSGDITNFPFPTGSNEVTYTVTDVSGNVSTCSFEVKVNDGSVPVITCPTVTYPSGKAYFATDNGICTSRQSFSAPQATDNCTPADQLTKTYEISNGVNIIGSSSGDIIDFAFPVGTNTVTYTVTDNAGNSVTCIFNVEVKDEQEPVAICKDITAILDIATGIVVITPQDIDNGSWDNCSLAVNAFALDKTTFNCTNIGDNEVRLTVTDAYGNTASCLANVHVRYDASLLPAVTPDMQEICSGNNAGLVLSNPGFEAVTGWDWIVNSPAGINTVAPGTATGNYTISQVFTNSTDAVAQATYTITPKLYGLCTVQSIDATILVNPQPKLVAMKDSSICNGSFTQIPIKTNSIVSQNAAVYYGWTVSPNIVGAINALAEQGIDSPLDQQLNHSLPKWQEVTYTLSPSLHLNGNVCTYPGSGKQFKIIVEPTPVIKVQVDNDTICNKSTIKFSVDSLNWAYGKWQYQLVRTIPTNDEATPEVPDNIKKQGSQFSQMLDNHATRWHRTGYRFSPEIVTQQGHACAAPQNDSLLTIYVNPTPLMRIVGFQDSICFMNDGPEILMTSSNGAVIGDLKYNLWKVDYSNADVTNVHQPATVDFTGRNATLDQTALWNTSDFVQTVAYYLYPVIEYRSLHCAGDSVQQNVYIAPEVKFDMIAKTYTGGHNISCYNAADGEIKADNAHGGWTAKGYDYEWTGLSNAGNTNTISHLRTNKYGVTVIDKILGCQTNKEITLTEPNALLTSIQAKSPDCNGPTGEITITATGGTRSGAYPYLYHVAMEPTFSYTGNDSSFINLKSGEYKIRVTDVNGCTSSEKKQNLDYYSGITKLTNVNWNASTYGPDANGVTYQITCNGANNGAMRPALDPVVSAYEWKYNGTVFKKDSVAPGGYFTLSDWSVYNLKPGKYDFTITDNKGCKYSTDQQTIKEPPAITFTSDVPKYPNGHEVKCDESKTGRILITNVAGGYGERYQPYKYEWSTSTLNSGVVDGAQEQQTLGVGTYTLTIKNYRNIDSVCKVTKTFTLNGPDTLKVKGTLSNYNGYQVKCFGEHSGSIHLSVSGGDGGYSYQWSTADGAGLVPKVANQTALTAGTYTVDITYSSGLCTKTIPSYTLSSPSKLKNDSVVFPIKCHGDTNASIQTSISGGLPAYNYHWSSPDVTVSNPTAQNQSNLHPGTYWLVVTDRNGCVKMETYSLREPALVSPNIIAEDMSCDPGNDGYITAAPSGGTQGYTYLWSNGATTARVTDLVAGNYSVTVTDANNCTGTANASINVPKPITVLASVTTDFNGYNIDCYGNNTGKIGLEIVNGRGPYTYLWSSGANTDRIDHATAGIYQVNVTDHFNCKGSASVTLTQPDQLYGQSITTDITCPGGDNGSIQILAGGGILPYRYEWSTVSTDAAVADHLKAGNYPVRIIDNNNCFLDLNATLTQPPPFKVDFTTTDAFCPETDDGEIRAMVTGGTAPYSYLWTGLSGATSPNVTDIKAGSYTLEVTDAVNCKYSSSVEIGYSSDACLKIPNAFSPNDDGSNDRWEIMVGDPNAAARYQLRDLYPEAIIQVYSANWGILLYTSQKGYPEPWDGKYKGKFLPVNSYFYIIKLNSSTKPITGNVTIIR